MDEQMREVKLTMDELEAAVTLLRQNHNASDFEPECPTCLAFKKLDAALKRPAAALSQPAAAINAELLGALQHLFNSYKSLADSGDAGKWKLEEQPEGIRALAAIAKASAQVDSSHSAGGECGGVQVVWPKENRVGRREDMSPDGVLIVGLDSDNDVYVEVSAERHGQWQSAAVEFCNGGGGGGQSSRTRAALISLMTAMEADNAAHPYKAFPGAPKATP